MKASHTEGESGLHFAGGAESPEGSSSQVGHSAPNSIDLAETGFKTLLSRIIRLLGELEPLQDLW